METLAYLHLVLANETEADTEYTALIVTIRRRIPSFKSTHVTMQFFGLTVALLLFGMANQAMALVQEGDRSSEVTFIQQRLQQLGYFQGNITGYFGSMTKQAVMRFQEAKGLTADGMVGTNTQASLQSPQKENQAVRAVEPRESQSVKPVQPKESQASVKVASQETRPILLQIGDRGSQVTILQEGLAAAGFSSGTNGLFDAATYEAVKLFQQAKGLSVDGIVGAQTRAALPAIGGQNPTFTAINPPKPAEIKAMQKRLQVRGFYGGSIDGLWGPQTQAAVESAQKAYSVSIEDLPNHGF
jgi:peptidoglycan hydrolase-like protein with peptidoglycan-binding domain